MFLSEIIKYKCSPSELRIVLALWIKETGLEKGYNKIEISNKELADATGLSTAAVSVSLQRLIINQVIRVDRPAKRHQKAIFHINKKLQEWQVSVAFKKTHIKIDVYQALFSKFFNGEKTLLPKKDFINQKIRKEEPIDILFASIKYILQNCYEISSNKLLEYCQNLFQILELLLYLDGYNFDIAKDTELLFPYLSSLPNHKKIKDTVSLWCSIVSTSRPDYLEQKNPRLNLKKFISRNIK